MGHLFALTKWYLGLLEAKKDPLAAYRRTWSCWIRSFMHRAKVPIVIVFLGLVGLISLGATLAATASVGVLGASNQSAPPPTQQVLVQSNLSELPLDYPWSPEEQAQRDRAIQQGDSSLLPECTKDYFAWRAATQERREAARGTEPPSGGFWDKPGCKGVPDRLVVGPQSQPGLRAEREPRLDLSDASELPLDYPWSREEQAQRPNPRPWPSGRR